MGTNFNIVKKNVKKEEDSYEEDEQREKTNELLARKRMFRFMGIIISVALIILIFLYLLSLITKGGRNYSYERIEVVLKNAAISYFKDYPENLPENDGDVVEVDSSTLTSASKMKDISAYTKKGVVCTGSVKVQKVDNDYSYTPILNCGENYSSKAFYQYILDKETVVTKGYGLYEVNGNYIYRGEEVNNYVSLDNGLWRIVRVNYDGTIKLISLNGFNYVQSWDNRYNESKGFDSGINDYEASRIKEYMDKLFNTKNEKEKTIVSKNDKSKLVNFDVCIGKRNNSSDVSSECNQVIKNQKYGLLTLSEYMFASVDPNCVRPDNKSCKNYNYLVNKKEWWLGTAFSDNSFNVYKVGAGGNVSLATANIYAYVRPVVMLNSNVRLASGSGTFDEPYILK